MALAEVPPLFRKSVGPKEAPLLVQEPSDRLKLYRGADDKGRYVSSPFVTKVEFRLRLAEVPYSIGEGAPWQGPKGKIPYLEVAGELDSKGKPLKLGDSTLIFQHFVDEGKIQSLNDNLNTTEKAHDLALRSLLEDKLYFYHVRSHVTQAARSSR